MDLNRPIFLTGGSGLLALNWAVALRSHYKVVLGLHQRKINLRAVETMSCSLDDVSQLRRIIGEVRPAIIVHTAGMTNVEQCQSEPTQAHHVNVELAQNVATIAAECDARLIHISTDHIFSGQHPFTSEEESPDPQNVYAFTKAAAESAVRNLAPRSLIVRTNFFGWGTSYRKSFSDVIVEALRGGRRIRLFQDVFFTPILAGIQQRAVMDLVRAGVDGTFNVVGDERISKKDFGHKVAHHFGLDAGLIESGLVGERQDLTRRPQDMSLCNRKVTNVLGRPMGDTDSQLHELVLQEQGGFSSELRAL